MTLVCSLSSGPWWHLSGEGCVCVCGGVSYNRSFLQISTFDTDLSETNILIIPR